MNARQIRYEVRTGNLAGCYSPDRYSKYFKRLAAYDAGKLRGQIYGLKQAIEHVEELKKSTYEGKKHLADKTFTVVKVVTIETVVKVIL